MKMKVSKHKSHFREEVEISNTRTAYVMHIPNTQSLPPARNNRKQKFQRRSPQSTSFNNVTSYALFYGGHLVMRSAKPGNHLKRAI